MRFRTLLLTLALFAALPVLAGDKPAAPPVVTPPPPPVAPAPVPVAAPPTAATAAERVCKVFAVGDLIIPMPSANGQSPPGAFQKNADALVRVIAATVRPATWAEAGGQGRVEFFDLGSSLVVENTPAAVAEVGQLLDALRRLAGPQIAYEVRLVRGPVGLCARAGLKPGALLTDAQVRAALEAVRGEPAATVMQFPKVTLFDGQTATVRAGEEQKLVTGVEAMKVKGQTVFVPKHTSVYLGDVLTLGGTASADGGVKLRLQLARTALAGDPELVPVVTQITPIFEGGSQGKPVPLTQFLQAADVRTERVDHTATAPAGNTAVLGGWAEPAAAKPAKGKPAGACEVVVLATPRVIRADEPAEARASCVHKLRNVAAADAERALAAHFAGQNVACVAEPVSNTLLVSAEKEQLEKAGRLIAALDKAPPQVVVQAVVLDVDPEFVARAGLGAGADKLGCATHALTGRETQMLGELIRHAKADGKCDVLSRPQMQLLDRQTGYARIGQDFPVQLAGGKVEHHPVGFSLRLTPAVAPDGKSVTLKAEAEHVAVQPGAVDVGGVKAAVFNKQAVSGTAAVEFGGSVCFVAGTRKHATRSVDGDGKVTEHATSVTTVVILTPHLVKTEPEVKPAAGWFTR